MRVVGHGGGDSAVPQAIAGQQAHAHAAGGMMPLYHGYFQQLLFPQQAFRLRSGNQGFPGDDLVGNHIDDGVRLLPGQAEGFLCQWTNVDGMQNFRRNRLAVRMSREAAHIFSVLIDAVYPGLLQAVQHHQVCPETRGNRAEIP